MMALCYSAEITTPGADGEPRGDAALLRRNPFRRERVLKVTHSLDYRYLQPILNVTTRFRLLPPPVRGAQRLLSSTFHHAPLPDVSRQYADEFGNKVLEVHHEKVWKHLTLVVEMEVENACRYAAEGQVTHSLLPLEVEGLTTKTAEETYRPPTPLTMPDVWLEETAAETLRQYGDGGGDAEGLAFALCRRVYRQMHYQPGSTAVHTTAAESWAAGKGVCQDYAHILIALCRLSGLPARYVSGFLPGEGAMHAWVEVLIPDERGSGGWAALDPTHDRWVNERYVTVAVGRDYADITPTSGTYFGSGQGSSLVHRSRVQVENTREIPLDSGLLI